MNREQLFGEHKLVKPEVQRGIELVRDYRRLLMDAVKEIYDVKLNYKSSEGPDLDLLIHNVGRITVDINRDEMDSAGDVRHKHRVAIVAHKYYWEGPPSSENLAVQIVSALRPKLEDIVEDNEQISIKLVDDSITEREDKMSFDIVITSEDTGN